jgi:hypothetical protein
MDCPFRRLAAVECAAGSRKLVSDLIELLRTSRGGAENVRISFENLEHAICSGVLLKKPGGYLLHFLRRDLASVSLGQRLTNLHAFESGVMI